MALPIPTQQPWQHNGIELRAVELAEKRGMTYARTRFGVGLRDGREVWNVKSRTDVTQVYAVIYDPATDRVTGCSCPATGACWHMGVTRMRVEHRKSLTAPVDAEAPVLTVVPPTPAVVVPVLTPKPEHIGACDLCNEVARLYTYEDENATVYYCGDCGADDLSA